MKKVIIGALAGIAALTPLVSAGATRAGAVFAAYGTNCEATTTGTWICQQGSNNPVSLVTTGPGVSMIVVIAFIAIGIWIYTKKKQ
jgi:hypothetical protein